MTNTFGRFECLALNQYHSMHITDFFWCDELLIPILFHEFIDYFGVTDFLSSLDVCRITTVGQTVGLKRPYTILFLGYYGLFLA